MYSYLFLFTIWRTPSNHNPDDYDYSAYLLEFAEWGGEGARERRSRGDGEGRGRRGKSEEGERMEGTRSGPHFLAIIHTTAFLFVTLAASHRPGLCQVPRRHRRERVRRRWQRWRWQWRWCLIGAPRRLRSKIIQMPNPTPSGGTCDRETEETTK